MKRIWIILPLLLALSWFTSGEQTFAREKGGSAATDNVRLYSTTQQTATRSLVNVGQVAMWIYSNANSAIDPAGNSGLYFPRGNTPSTTAIFEDGLVWGGLVQDGRTKVISVGGGTYSQGNVAGAILGIRTGENENRNDLQNVNRVWRIRRDYATADLTQDAAEFNQSQASQVTDGQIATLRAIYKQDWIDWPVQKGAPFYDADGDGQYTPGFRTNADGIEVPKLRPGPNEEFDPAIHADEPGTAAADQVVWLVTNDLETGPVTTLYGSDPIGIEQQVTLWAYNRADALGQIIFKQFRLIYKGTETAPASARIDSMFVCQWSDPDLGGAGDDFVGSDTTLSLGYCYNSNNNDAIYSSVGLPPPASGYDFFAGPLVEEAGATAIFGLKRREGFRNLPMTTFGFFAAGGQDSDPTRGGDYNGTLQWWNLLRGFRPRPENPQTPWEDPTQGNAVTKFVLTGDPATGQGWIDSNPGDRRLLLASGPFTMALGDTQEAVVAVLAALGSDRISSVQVLKFVDIFAQTAFDSLFVLDNPPAKPIVTATQLDQEIVLNWGTSASVAATEQTAQGIYQFEGYNVYQLPTAGAPLDQAVKIATIDLRNDVTNIIQETFDQRSGLILALPVQQGKDTGIQRTFTLNRDFIRERDLVNGQTYYFGVTAYSYTPEEVLVRSLESTPSVVTVVPQMTKPGVQIAVPSGDALPVTHDGISDGNAVPTVINPEQLTGDSYKVVFGGAPGPDQVWDLINTTTGDTLLKDQTNQTGDTDYETVDGFELVVTGAPLDFAPGDGSGGGIIEVANPAGDPCGPDASSTGGCAAFGGNTVWHSGNSTGDYYVTAGNNGNLSSLQRYINFAVPFDYEMRFTDEGGWAVFAFTDDKIARVPFEIWNIGSGTPDDPSDDYRMIPFLNENVETSDHWGWGTGEDPAFGFPMSDWVYWMDPQDPSGTSSYDQFASFCETNGAGGTYPFDSDGSTDGYWADFHGGFVYPIGRWALCDLGGTGTPPPSGTTIRIVTTKPNTPADVFSFSSSVPTFSTADAKENALEMINVFPNPYVGFNAFENNRFQRRITFSHLPQKATVRIFNLAGVLVRTLEKDDASQFLNWNLQNEDALPVASGLYIVHIEMPDLGATKMLKMAIIQEQQFLRNF